MSEFGFDIQSQVEQPNDDAYQSPEEEAEARWRELPPKEKYSVALTGDELAERGFKFEVDPTLDRRLEQQLQEHLRAGHFPVVFSPGGRQRRMAYLEPDLQTDWGDLFHQGYYIDFVRTTNGVLSEKTTYLFLKGLERGGRFILLPRDEGKIRTAWGPTVAAEIDQIPVATDRKMWSEE